MIFALLQMNSVPDGTSTSLVLFGCLIFTALLVFFVFSPGRTVAPEIKTRLAYLYERKEQVYENLRDLNFEYKAGKLGNGDFHSLRDSLEQEAANVLSEIDRLERSGMQPAMRG